jgi:hypothetical protein
MCEIEKKTGMTAQARMMEGNEIIDLLYPAVICWLYAIAKPAA